MKLFKALGKELKRELKGIGKGAKSIVKPQTIEVDGETLFIVDFKAKMHEKDGYKRVGEVQPFFENRTTKYRLLMTLEEK